jgi:hypothetical protein
VTVRDLLRLVAGDPVPAGAALLQLTCLMIVGRWRRIGWTGALIAQVAFTGYGWVSAQHSFVFCALPALGYLWLHATRRGERWRGIPTPRQLARKRDGCSGCCVHGARPLSSPVLAVPAVPPPASHPAGTAPTRNGRANHRTGAAVAHHSARR